jgi:predicted unusual protein kinase regulating ubiquinone biosynthesis (AarF/ABC1/UbiB family)
MEMNDPHCSCLHSGSEEGRAKAVMEAVRHSNTDPFGPSDGIVAVKVQYPDALPLFEVDLKNIRRLAGFLSRTEIRFDLVSAVDELSSQVKFEFNFERWASWIT